MVNVTHIKMIIERFLADQRGTTAVMFALLAVPLMFAVGLSIDFARAFQYREKMLQTAEAALGSAIGGSNARSMDTRADDARKAFAAFAAANGVVAADPIDVSLRNVSGAVDGRVTFSSDFKLFFGKALHLSALRITVEAGSARNVVNVAERRRLCHIGRAEDIKRLACGREV